MRTTGNSNTAMTALRLRSSDRPGNPQKCTARAIARGPDAGTHGSQERQLMFQDFKNAAFRYAAHEPPPSHSPLWGRRLALAVTYVTRLRSRAGFEIFASPL